MELVFNELTCFPYADDYTKCYTIVELFVKTYKESESHGFKRIRFQQASFDQIFLMRDYTLADFLKDHPNNKFAQILFSVKRYPFIDDDSEEEKRYIQNHFFLSKNGGKISVHGIAAAYLYNTIGIGFLSEVFWDTIVFVLQIEGLEKKCVNVLSVSQPKHFGEQAFLDWKEESGEEPLTESGISVSEKSISLRDDHGKEVLQKFAEQLRYSPYVVEIVNSLPYNPNKTKFIHKVTATGLVEIVLANTDEGLGLVVKTTGQNMRETRKIADILKQSFS